MRDEEQRLFSKNIVTFSLSFFKREILQAYSCRREFLLVVGKRPVTIMKTSSFINETIAKLSPFFLFLLFIVDDEIRDNLLHAFLRKFLIYASEE